MTKDVTAWRRQTEREYKEAIKHMKTNKTKLAAPFFKRRLNETEQDIYNMLTGVTGVERALQTVGMVY
jgi:hypothetical protein